jgi:hypothetical protein
MVKRQRAANGDWRMVKQKFSGGQCSCTAEKFFGASGDAPSNDEILGSPGGSPSRIFSRRMNSALRKVHHQPLAKASSTVSFETPVEGGQANHVAMRNLR